MLGEYEKTQPIAYKIIVNSVNKQKISHAYLIESNGYSKKLDFAKAFSKFLLCPENKILNNNCQSCNICHRIDTNNFTELKIISPDGLWIKKEQLEILQKEFSKKSVESNKKIYIINGAEKMNAAAFNSILKFLEEPEPDIIAILITDNIYQLTDTIISRCQTISLKNDFINSELIMNSNQKLIFNIASKRTTTIDEMDEILKNEKYIDYINSAVKFVETYEKIKIGSMTEINNIWNQTFKEKEKIILGLDIIILFYKDILNYKLKRNVEVFDDFTDKISEIANKNNQKEICEKIKIILKAKDKINHNANNNLLMDKLLIELMEVS